MCRNVATCKLGDRVAASYCTHLSFRLSRLELASYCIKRVGERTRAIYARDSQSETVRMTLEAILKIYAHELMGFISPDELLRVRPRCVLLRHDLYTGCSEKSRIFFYNTYITCIRKRAKSVWLDYWDCQSAVTFVFWWCDFQQYRNVIIWLILLN